MMSKPRSVEEISRSLTLLSLKCKNLEEKFNQFDPSMSLSEVIEWSNSIRSDSLNVDALTSGSKSLNEGAGAVNDVYASRSSRSPKRRLDFSYTRSPDRIPPSFKLSSVDTLQSQVRMEGSSGSNPISLRQAAMNTINDNCLRCRCDIDNHLKSTLSLVNVHKSREQSQGLEFAYQARRKQKQNESSKLDPGVSIGDLENLVSDDAIASSDVQ